MSRRIVTVFALSMASACVRVPSASQKDAGASADASWLDELALDGGGQRPQNGEPYRGPECDSASSVRASGPPASFMDGGLAADASAAPTKGGKQPETTEPAKSSAIDPAQLRHPQPGEIVITEIMSNPAAVLDTAGEWFELHNPSASDARDLGGCSIEDGAAKPHVMPAPFVVGKDEYVVVGRSAEAGFAPDLILSFSLGNSADTLVLRCDGREIDRVAYDGSFPLLAGASMSLDPAANADDNDTAGAWCLGQEEYAGDRGTPGQPNPPCDDGDADVDAGMK